LRNFRHLKEPIEAGAPIDLFDRKTLMGHIIPESARAEYIGRQTDAQRRSSEQVPRDTSDEPEN
jgi:hypothetical protein